MNDVFKNMEEKDGFFKHNNYHVIEANENEVIIRADLDENSMNPYGMAHGGFIFGLGDTLMGMLAATVNKKALTLNANISYLAPGTGKYLIAKGEIVKKGKTISLVRANIYNDQKKLISTMESTYYYFE